MKTKYCIQSNDGRFVSQQGFKPALVESEGMAYTWPTSEEAKARLDAYWGALKGTGILALAVMPFQLEGAQS